MPDTVGGLMHILQKDVITSGIEHILDTDVVNPTRSIKEECRNRILDYTSRTHERFVQTLNLPEHRGALAGPIKEDNS